MQADKVPIQTGPGYRCFQCGAQPATFAACFEPCGSPLDSWSRYIWYLRLPCACQDASRVVRLGDAITPLAAGSPGGLGPADIPAIRAALQALIHAIPEEFYPKHRAARIVYGLLAGTVTPHEAIQQLSGPPARTELQPVNRLPLPSEPAAVMDPAEGASP